MSDFNERGYERGGFTYQLEEFVSNFEEERQMKWNQSMDMLRQKIQALVIHENLTTFIDHVPAQHSLLWVIIAFFCEESITEFESYSYETMNDILRFKELKNKFREIIIEKVIDSNQKLDEMNEEKDVKKGS